MELDTFIELVKNRFDFFMKEGAFIVVSGCRYGNCAVILQVNGYKLKIIYERGGVEVGAAVIDAPNDSFSGSYELTTLISFITRGPTRVSLRYNFDWMGDERATVDHQLVHIVEIFTPYWGIISDFFVKEGFKERIKGYNKFQEEELERRGQENAERNKSILGARKK